MYDYVVHTGVNVSDPDWPARGVITRIDCYGTTLEVSQQVEVDGRRGKERLKLETGWHNVLTLGYLGLNMPQTALMLDIELDEATHAKSNVIDILQPFSPVPERRRFPPILHGGLIAGFFEVNAPNTAFDFQAVKDDPYDRQKLLTAAAITTASGRWRSAFGRYARVASETQQIVKAYRNLSRELGIPYDDGSAGIVLFGHATGILPSIQSRTRLEKMLPETIASDVV